MLSITLTSSAVAKGLALFAASSTTVYALETRVQGACARFFARFAQSTLACIPLGLAALSPASSSVAILRIAGVIGFLVLPILTAALGHLSQKHHYEQLDTSLSWVWKIHNFASKAINLSLISIGLLAAINSGLPVWIALYSALAIINALSLVKDTGLKVNVSFQPAQ